MPAVPGKREVPRPVPFMTPEQRIRAARAAMFQQMLRDAIDGG